MKKSILFTLFFLVVLVAFIFKNSKGNYIELYEKQKYSECIRIIRKTLEKHNVSEKDNVILNIYLQLSYYHESQNHEIFNPMELETLSNHAFLDKKIRKKTYLVLASYYAENLNFMKAIKFAEKGLQNISSRNSEYAYLLNAISKCYYNIDDYQKAFDLGLESLKIANRKFKSNDINYAIILENLSLYYCAFSKFQEAIALGEQALKIRELRNVDFYDKQYSVALNNLAYIYSCSGNYQKAFQLHSLDVEVSRRIFGLNDYNYAISLNNLANIYFELGNYQKAFDLRIQSLDIVKKERKEKHVNYASFLNDLSISYLQIEDYQKAIQLSELALKIKKDEFGERSLIYATSLSNLSIMYSYLNDFDNSIKRAKEAMEINGNILGRNHLIYAMSLNNLSSIYFKIGLYEQAINFGLQAIKILEGKTYVDNHASLIVTSNLFNYYLHVNDFQEAHVFLDKALNLVKRNLQTQFIWLTEKERNLYLSKSNEMFELLYSINHINKFSFFEDASYNIALLSKGVILQSSIEINKILTESCKKETIEKIDKLRVIHHTLNRLYEKPIAERCLNTDSLETVAQNLEREILTQSKEYGDYTRFMSITWQDVQKSLSDKDIAIEFVEFPVLKSDSIMYAALMLRKDWEHPQMIPLFEKKQIEPYLQQTPDKQYSGNVGKQLYELMWKPLEKVIQKGDNVYFSAAGVYHQLALEYFPSDNGTPLCDLYHLRRLSSTRQLVMEESNAIVKNATLYGGIEYDMNPTQMLAESKKYAQDESLFAYRGMSLDSLRGSRWVSLDNTVPEVSFISTELEQNKVKTDVFTGIEANEESFKDLSGKKVNILHLATHGFFLPIEEIRKIDYFQMLGRDNNPTPDMSMRRSGLVMAGGNRAWSGDTIPEGVDDGILTAQEISVLDFRDMDLVVLSACETGLGDINTSEGVFGLQRAFKKAGAKTLVMSLWKVNDEITKSLMNKFYQSLFTGKSKHEAFLEAQQFIRSRHPEPQNWAAFIMLD